MGGRVVAPRARITGLCLALAAAAPLGGQSSIVGTAYDSLGTRGPLRGATVILIERSRYATTDANGRFRFDSVPSGEYSLGLLHAVLDSFDLAVPPVRVHVASDSVTMAALATPSAQTAFDAGCAVRLSQASSKQDVVEYLKIRVACASLLRRSEQQAAASRAPGNTIGARGKAQALGAVVVLDSARSMSPMAIYGYEQRRRMGLGRFITPEFLAKNQFSSLATLLGSSPAVKVEYGTTGKPVVYLRGCVPTYWIDNMEFSMANLPKISWQRDAEFQAFGRAFGDLNAMAPPFTIKAVEIYAAGQVPAQYDRTSSTGCGSVVIWTR